MNREQIAIITGACGDIGRAITRELLRCGFYVAATDIECSEEQNDKRCQYFVMDISDLSSIRNAASVISSFFSAPVAVLINNAGIYEKTPVMNEKRLEAATQVIETNLLGAIHCTNVFSRKMLPHKFGRIVNISSIAGIWGAGYASAYAASKAGLIAAAKSWARELGPFGITVNTVVPGLCKTEMFDGSQASTQAEQMLLPLIPVKRFGTPEDVAEVVAFFATCRSSYVNGSVITVDGGLLTGDGF